MTLFNKYGEDEVLNSPIFDIEALHLVKQRLYVQRNR